VGVREFCAGSCCPLKKHLSELYFAYYIVVNRYCNYCTLCLMVMPLSSFLYCLPSLEHVVSECSAVVFKACTVAGSCSALTYVVLQGSAVYLRMS
jgi:hypothetical protein